MITEGLATLLAAAIAGVVGWITSASTNSTNKQLSQQNNDLQRQLVATANQQNIEQWQRENAYNTPALQMERLRAAGLNPSLTMTNGSLMNEAAASPQMQAASVRASQVQTPQIPTALDVAQIDLLKAQAARTKAEIPVLTQQVENLHANTEYLNRLSVLSNEQALKEHESFVNLLNQNNLFAKTFENQLSMTESNASILREQAAKYKEQLQSQLDLNAATIRNLDADGKLKGTQIELNKEQKNQITALANMLDSQKKLIDKQFGLIEKYGDAEKVIGMINQTLSAIGSATSGTASLIGTILSRGQSPTFSVPENKPWTNPLSN